jgi:hypothetical protein
MGSNEPLNSELLSRVRELEEQVRDHRRLQESLEDRLRFEGLITDLSARFVSITPDQVDGQMGQALLELPACSSRTQGNEK